MIAIVLARHDFREDDQLVTLYTREQGRRDVVAKGLKKMSSKNSMHLQPLSVCDVTIIHGKEIDHAAKVQTIEVFQALHHNLAALSAASFAAELVRVATRPHEKDERIFNLLHELLRQLSQPQSVNIITLIAAFMMKLWRCLGFTLELKQCVRCRKTADVLNRNYVMHVASGGLVCPACARGLAQTVLLSVSERAYLQTLLNNHFASLPVVILPKTSVMRMYNLVHAFAQFHGEQRLANFMRHASMVNIL